MYRWVNNSVVGVHIDSDLMPPLTQVPVVQDNGVVVKGNPHKITALHVMYDMKDQGFQDLLKAGGARERASTLQQHCGPAAVLLPVTNLLKHAAHPTILT
eukprot:8117-Eustigmatos_ZCMA.PRE.1